MPDTPPADAGTPTPDATIATPPLNEPVMTGDFDQTELNRLMATYVNAQGLVNYAGLAAHAADRAALDAYVTSVGTANPAGMETFDQIAFWINAYNALVVKAVVDRWPLASVRDVDGFFDRLRYQVAGEMMSLNELEEFHMRSVFDEPRIHFALNCGAISCPPLRQEAYRGGGRLEEQLEEQSVNFVRATTRLDPENRGIHVSAIFEWYSRDFERVSGARGFTADRAYPGDEGFIRATRNFMRYDEYDWTINAAP